MAVLTTDHEIGAPDRFRATVDAALRFAAENDALVTIGVQPTRAETGYGYVEVEANDDPRSASGTSHERDASGASGAVPVPRRVLRFREKPDPATAEQYLRSGRHYWNSGMFFWRVATFLQGLEHHMAPLHAATRRMIASLGPDSRAALREIFTPLADVSVDVGLMEHARNVWMIPAVFPWDDVGAWDALERSRPKDSSGNVVVGDPIFIDARDCIVFNDAGADHMAVAVVGVDNLIVATTPDGVLVCTKERAQDVRRVVAELRARQRGRFT
jgi:mannose-1-phosphate guanylyltransferase